ncbi:MAG: hypothetical protein ACRCX2_30105 [Paraclostridium sp.]
MIKIGKKTIYEIGDIIGDLIIINDNLPNYRTLKQYEVKCTICGTTKVTVSQSLNKGVGVKHGQSCTRVKKYNIGCAIGDFTIIDILPKINDKSPIKYLVKCNICENTKTLLSTNISKSKGIIHSPYCLQDEHDIILDKKLQQIYNGIKRRCSDVNHQSYKYYGEKGIMCEWKTLSDFKRDMWKSFIEACETLNHPSIERMDNSKNYSKDNCIWIDMFYQAKNKSTSRKIKAVHSSTGEIRYFETVSDFVRFANPTKKDRLYINKNIINNPNRTSYGWYIFDNNTL